jgi:hypothetical protein
MWESMSRFLENPSFDRVFCAQKMLGLGGLCRNIKGVLLSFQMDFIIMGSIQNLWSSKNWQKYSQPKKGKFYYF